MSVPRLSVTTAELKYLRSLLRDRIELGEDEDDAPQLRSLWFKLPRGG